IGNPSLNHRYRKGFYSLFKTLQQNRNKSFWSKRYYVSTVGLNQKTNEKYIREQEADDRIRYIISKREYVEPFKK
ncbi:hypothetical protein ACNPLV_14145, partial [Enterococcus faecium]